MSARPEPWGVWSDGPAATLLVETGAPGPATLVLVFTPWFPEDGAQTLAADIGGETVARGTYRRGEGGYELVVPLPASTGPLEITLRPGSIRPEDAHPTDRRRIGIGLWKIALRGP